MSKDKLGTQTIALIGMMGAGKTTLGKVLAKSLALPFCDSDAEIEKAAQMSVRDIFTKHGEQYFRDGERRVIARLLNEPPHILALGGGAFEDAETRKAVAASALSVWLSAPLEELVARVSKGANKRPLVANEAGDISTRLAELLKARTPNYARADIIFDMGAQPLARAQAALLQNIQDYYNKESQ